MRSSLRRTTTGSVICKTGPRSPESEIAVSTLPITKLSTSRLVDQTRRELLVALTTRRQISSKVTAYTNAVRRHRESIFADVLRETRPAATRC